MRLLLWDIDHTLVRTTDFDREVYLRVAAEAVGVAEPRLPPSGAGRTEPHTVDALLDLNGVGPRRRRRMLPQVLERLRDGLTADPDRMRALGAALPGAREAMRRAAALPGVAVGVATGNLRGVAEAKLSAFGLDRHVDWHRTGYGDDAPTKTGVVARARRAAGPHDGPPVPAERTVLVGDSPADAAVARAGQARVLGVASGRASPRELFLAGADAVLPDLADPDAFADAVLRLLR